MKITLENPIRNDFLLIADGYTLRLSKDAPEAELPDTVNELILQEAKPEIPTAALLIGKLLLVAILFPIFLFLTVWSGGFDPWNMEDAVYLRRFVLPLDPMRENDTLRIRLEGTCGCRILAPGGEFPFVGELLLDRDWVKSEGRLFLATLLPVFALAIGGSAALLTEFCTEGNLVAAAACGVLGFLFLAALGVVLHRYHKERKHLLVLCLPAKERDKIDKKGA